MAREFLEKLEKVLGIHYLVNPVLEGHCQSEPATWAGEVINFISTEFQMEARIQQLKPISDFASEMLTHLLIATRNPGGKKTPQESFHSTPNLAKLNRIKDLLDAATTKKSQLALKELLFLRDGYHCPFTDIPFAPPHAVVARAAHILPFSFDDKTRTLSVLETFSGRELAKEVKDNINHPWNAFNVESNTHDAYHKLAWGIEAVQVGDKWKYVFREVRSDDLPRFIKRGEGEEIIFGLGDTATLDKPNPEYCNLKLAVARAMNACGVAGIIAGTYGDDDDDEAITTQPVYMGGAFISDDVLFRRLDDRLQAYINDN